MIARPGPFRASFLAAHSVVLLAALASVTSLANGFVYDDVPIVETNPRVHSLARPWQLFVQPYWPDGWGDAGYRPFAILAYALQWALGGGSPAVYHVVNVLLYVAASVAVLNLARLRLVPHAAWLAAALFASHPVHVEAVGNVVGQAEIIVGLCSIVAVTMYIRARDAGGRLGRATIAGVSALFAVACFTKESGFMLPALLVVAEVTVVAPMLGVGRRPLVARLGETWPVYAVCGAIAAAYLVLRLHVLGNAGDDPSPVLALLATKSRLLTMLGVVPEWARLLLWPARLAADYSPRQIAVYAAPAWSLAPSVLILAGALVVGAAGWVGRRVVTFAVLWIVIALLPVSNLFVRSGILLAERTLFLPSVGAAIGVAAAAAWAAARIRSASRLGRALAAVPVALLLIAGVVHSAQRQRVWRSNDHFFAHIVNDAPLGYRAHHMHGMWLFTKGKQLAGERHVRTAIALFPFDPAVHTDLADQYRRSGLCAPALGLYRRAIELRSPQPRTRVGLVACLLHESRFAEARDEARQGIVSEGASLELRHMLAVADSVLADESVKTTQTGVPRAPRR